MSFVGWRVHARATVSALLFVAVVGLPGGLRAPAVALAQDGAPVRYTVVTDGSEVRYRVREQLVGVSFPNDAVGATSAVEGTVALDAQGRVIPGASRLTVDLRTLRSDQGRRDNYVRRNTLETDRFPTVTFVPTEVRGLPVPLPQTGSVPIELVGDLTVKDVTRRVTWEGTATFDGPRVAVRARTAFKFEDFNLRVPRVSVVLSVENDIKLEADLALRRSS
jgi:polyisoprenoid-binding protein YceI